MANDWDDLGTQEGHLIEGRFRLGEVLSDRLARTLRLHDRAPALLTRIDLDEALESEFEGPWEEVDHPGVVPIWGRGVLAPGQGYIITPEPVGPTIDDVLEEGPFELSRVLQTLAALVSALKAVHLAGRVLVNLRPTVVGLVPGWSREQVRIPAASWVIGPPAGQPLGGYCAPEVDFQEPTPAADQFSLGVIAYELLTGTPPHNPEAPPGDRTLTPILPDPGVPKALEPLLKKLMGDMPAERYATFDEVAAEIDRLTTLLVPAETAVGHFTPIIPAGRTMLPDHLTPPQIEPAPDVPLVPPPDPILSRLLVLLAVFALAMTLSYVVVAFW